MNIPYRITFIASSVIFALIVAWGQPARAYTSADASSGVVSTASTQDESRVVPNGEVTIQTGVPDYFCNEGVGWYPVLAGNGCYGQLQVYMDGRYLGQINMAKATAGNASYQTWQALNSWCGANPILCTPVATGVQLVFSAFKNLLCPKCKAAMNERQSVEILGDPRSSGLDPSRVSVLDCSLAA